MCQSPSSRSWHTSQAWVYVVAAAWLLPCVLPATTVQLQPTLEKVDGSIEVVWQKPEQPKGVLLLFHGCSHSATDFFPESSGCSSCIAFPEEKRIVLAALQQQLAVVALSSDDREDSRCWEIANRKSNPTMDVNNVLQVVKVLLPKLQLDKLPLYALGSSNGGAFVLTLPMFLPLAGVCSELKALSEGLTKRVLKEVAADKRSYPPTAFVHMPRDAFSSSAVNQNAASLREEKVAVKTWEVLPAALTKDFLTAHLGPDLTPAAAAKVVTGLEEVLRLGPDGKMYGDPMYSDWLGVLLESQDPDVVAAAKLQGIVQVVRLAWGHHALAADPVPEVLQWLTTQAGSAAAPA